MQQQLTPKLGGGVAKHEHIFAQVKNRIVSGELQPGEALPSQADLMRDYGVALGTVRQVLNRLQSEGWVSSQRGKGSFVRTRGVQWKVTPTTAAVGLLAFGGPDVAEYDHLMAMRAALARENIELLVGVFSPTQIGAALDWARSLSGIMAWARPPREFMQRLVDANVPAVMLGNMHEGECPPGMSHVNFNLAGAVDQSVQLLGSMGHKRIVFVNRGGKDAEPYPEFSNRLSVLFDQTVKTRIADSVHEELALDVGETKRLIDYLDAADPAPTALLIEGGQRACGLMHEMEKAKWSSPSRISIVAISPLVRSKLANPDLSYVEMPMIQLAMRGAEVILELLRDRRLIRESISTVLHWGRTCRSVNP